MGIGMGLKGSSVPIFAAENSPAKIRGALGKLIISYGANEHLSGNQPKRKKARADCNSTRGARAWLEALFEDRGRLTGNGPLR